MVPAFPSVDSAGTDAPLFAALNGTMAESDCFNPFIIDSDYLLSSAAPVRRPGRIEALSGPLRGRTYVPGFQRRREALAPSRLPVRLHPLQTPQLDRDPARALAAQVTVERHKQLIVRHPPPDFSSATPRSATDPPLCEAAPANRGPSAFERRPRLRDRRRRRPRSGSARLYRPARPSGLPHRQRSEAPTAAPPTIREAPKAPDSRARASPSASAPPPRTARPARHLRRDPDRLPIGTVQLNAGPLSGASARPHDAAAGLALVMYAYRRASARRLPSWPSRRRYGSDTAPCSSRTPGSLVPPCRHSRDTCFTESKVFYI